jgi:hypothetical protein
MVHFCTILIFKNECSGHMHKRVNFVSHVKFKVSMVVVVVVVILVLAPCRFVSRCHHEQGGWLLE